MRHWWAIAWTIPALMLGGCVVSQPANPYPPPPAPVVESVPPAPSAVMVWQPGHYQWNGREYEWVRGRYVQRTVQTTRFVPGHWAYRGSTWVWVPGHWV